MTDAIIIVSLAPWARKGLWWRSVSLALRADLLPRPAVVLLAYFNSGRGGDCGAVSRNEAALLRGWATNVPGWRERADRGQYPLRFASYGVGGAAIDATGT